jgi:hypothetical protein
MALTICHPQEPPPVRDRSRSKNLMGLADPVTPCPKDEKSQYPESNISGREETCGYVHTELCVDGPKQPQTATSITDSAGHQPGTQSPGFDSSKPLSSEKSGSVDFSLPAHMKADGQHMIESESFIGNPDILRKIIGVLIKKHPRFTFTYDPTSGHPGNGWELERKDGVDNLPHYAPGTRMGKLPDRKRQILMQKERTIRRRARWQCVSTTLRL